jgi:hypothetical protein
LSSINAVETGLNGGGYRAYGSEEEKGSCGDLHGEGLETVILQMVQETDKSVYRGSVADGMILEVERLRVIYALSKVLWFLLPWSFVKCSPLSYKLRPAPL